jgi:hypothetical protein
MTDPRTLIQVTDDLKYLNRMSFSDFHTTLFPESTMDYLENKWRMFQADPLRFLWGCSSDKIQLICDYIKGEKNE